MLAQLLLVAIVLGGVGLALLVAFFASGVIRYIPNNRIGVVERLWSRKGSLQGGFIALHGEAGYQPDVLRGGWHVFFPFQVRVHQVPLVNISQGQIGYVFARDGQPLEPTQTLGSNEHAGDFSDAAAFLHNGGQRGPQRKILREGTYAINLAQFAIFTAERAYFLPLTRNEDAVFEQMSEILRERLAFQPIVISGSEDLCGVVTVHDGPSLGQGEIIAPPVGEDPQLPEIYHNNFQAPELFLAAGGRRGRQLQMLVDGTYYINRLFATVEFIPKTTVEVGFVGVVVSYTGEAGADLSGEEYSHGELVHRGKRGVWSTALMPGKYAFNTYAGRVIAVPTTNIILKWIRNQVGAHKYDENLSEVSLITKDAFEPSLPLSVVIHIDYRKAPLVIQRFGDIKRLVEQTLDPMVAAYFKNVGQTRTLIQLLQDRAAIQTLASQQMRDKFEHYNLELEEVLIGTPTSTAKEIEVILDQLRSRQIAEEQIETYQRQEKAAVQEKELREAQSRARQQQVLTESEVSIAIQKNEGRAEYERSVQKAQQIRAIAEADAGRVRLMAEAEAEKAARVGIAEAIAIEEQVRAYGGPRYQVVQQVMNRFAQAIEESKVEVVPRIVMGGQSQNAFEALINVLLSERLENLAVGAPQITERSPEFDAMATDIRKQLVETLKTKEDDPNGKSR